MKTVSRVLNNEPHVRPHMREKVLKAVETLGYKPNHAARALAGSRAYLLGFYYDNPSPGYISGIQFGAMKACRESGYHLVVEQLNEDVQFALLADTLRIDGVILSPPVCDRADVLDALDERGLPYVRLAPAGEFQRGPYLYMDDRRAAYEMTRHLLGLGHREIGFVRGPADHSAAPLRYEGFRQAMEEAGVAVAPEWVQRGNFSFRSGVGAAERLLALPSRPTAIFASNDDMALGVMAVANRLNFTIPEKLSVAGFDDAPIARVVWPQLTTVRQPVEAMAYHAARMLIDRLKTGDAPNGHLLDFEIVVRGSTAAPRGQADAGAPSRSSAAPAVRLGGSSSRR
ncbi:MAG: LacI family DNA-binding transcriptional regulator [Proteobacteria bacterium]|nr:LacI family DNA-binding transcriptional regulator [Pseudomonadota bacterium]